jgi:hypothetical protein
VVITLDPNNPTTDSTQNPIVGNPGDQPVSDQPVQPTVPSEPVMEPVVPSEPAMETPAPVTPEPEIKPEDPVVPETPVDIGEGTPPVTPAV